MSSRRQTNDSGASRPPEGTRRLRIALAYDGTGYAGWQRQPNGRTIQEELETALARLTGAPVTAHACSRTDQGVHARQLNCHVDIPDAAPSTDALLKGLNSILPADIRIWSVRLARPEYHARYDAKAKEYRYFIWNGPILPPDRRLYWTWIRGPLDVAAMQTAAKLLTGRQDFSSFTANPNRPIHSTVREIQSFRVRRRGHEIIVRIRADGFLYRMVRSLVGFLLRVGEGALQPESAREILHARERTARVPTAPPQGLFLWHVYY